MKQQHWIFRRVPASSQAGLALLLLLGAFAFNAAPENDRATPTSAPAPSESFTIMSFNIRYGTANDGPNRWEKRRTHVFDVIRRYKPSIIGLQEALQFQLDELKEALPQYDACGVGRDDGKKRGEFAAILFDRTRWQRVDGGTFWFSDTPEVVCSKSWGNDLCRICTWAQFRDRATGETLFHFNVHLDHKSKPARLRSAGLVLERIDSRQPAAGVILTGDFNAGEDSPPIRKIAGAKVALSRDGRSPAPARMMDTYRIIHPDTKDVGTFDDFVGRRTGDKIDYIFTPEGAFDVIDADIAHDDFDGAYPSDHFPIWATLRYRRSAAPGQAPPKTSR